MRDYEGAPGPRYIYLVEDDASLRSVMRGMLVGPGIEIAEFETGETFLDGYSDRPPGCVVLDVKLPGMSGLEVLERIAAVPPPNAIVMISGFGDIPSAVRAVKMGAADFVQKPFRREQLVTLVDKAFDAIEAKARNSRQLEALTPRERDVLIAFREGEQNKVVAARLGLSPRTVEMYRARLFAKLGVMNLSQALLRAKDAGLIN